MSKQRYLLIIVFVLLACLLAAQNQFSLETDLSYMTGGTGTGFHGLNRLTWSRELSSGLSAELNSTFSGNTLKNPGDLQRIWHNGMAGLHWNSDRVALRAGYRNLSFGDADILTLYPEWSPPQSLQRATQHEGLLAAAWDLPFLKTGAHLQARQLRATPWELDPNSFELVAGTPVGFNEVQYGADLSIPISDGLAASIAVDRKDDLFTETGQYTLTGLNGSLQANYRIGNLGELSARLSWTNRINSALDPEKRNLVQTTVRFQKKLWSHFAGFIQYTNNGCVNADLSQAYLLSNNLRAHFLFTLPHDPSGASYLMLGGKLSPENQASAAMLEGDLRLWESIYAGASCNYLPEKQLLLYMGKLSFYYNSLNDIHVQFSHRENLIDNALASSNYIGLGSSIHW